jgi:serine/threonine-protein kinase RsbW
MISHLKNGDLKLTIDSRLENIGLVGLSVQALSVYLGFDEVEAYRIQLGVVEAVTNVVKHAYGLQPDHEIKVEISLHPDRISFRITDKGSPMKMFGRPLKFDPADLASLPEGGMGLHIILQVMDEVNYQMVDGANILVMSKNLPQVKGESRF